ncbi:MAG: MATE family efflux transporter [Bdellovibrionales bacterium]|nr:MATE family efflux transporter [Bdellovibrionales bacterium]MBT3526683.1 MATE family efflux transporter [Bdellovibrionales bacterium]MBT7667976.1 MATE family efflux transporter [Bdellovibrionales bacterium]MBT7765608.1 MATE family efflux transporter [Bdellovibrionales bacterium]
MNKAIVELALFSLPIILGQLSQMLIGTGDTLVAGRISTEALGAIGVANGVISPVLVMGFGFLAGLSPLLSKKRGQGVELERLLPSTLLYSLMVSMVFFLLSLLLLSISDYLGIAPVLLPLVKKYLTFYIWSFWGAYIYMGLKEFLQAKEQTIFANSLALGMVALNISVNFLLVFGYHWVPALGFVGIPIASIIIRTLMAIIMITVILRRSGWRLQGEIDYQFIKEAFKLSYPIAFTIVLEVAAFGLISLFIGQINSLEAAAHNIAITLAGVAFMIPLGMASAVAVKVGHAYGRQSLADLRGLINANYVLTTIIMSLLALIFITLAPALSSLFSPEQSVVTLATKLLLIIAIFQLADGLHVTQAGVLRGLGVTRAPFIVSLLCYGALSIPLGLFLGHHQGMGAQGFWISLALALNLAGISLFVILRLTMKRVCQYFPSVKL